MSMLVTNKQRIAFKCFMGWHSWNSIWVATSTTTFTNGDQIRWMTHQGYKCPHCNATKPFGV